MGDAFGETWFRRPVDSVEREIRERRLSPGPWPWTDDTAMALPLLRMLDEDGAVDQDRLALAFANTYDADRDRGYGPSMHRVLREIGEGEPWRAVTSRQFGGQGSWGNGAAMRVAPLGAWFADDLAEAARQAAEQARVTHAHPEAVAGSVAVALAAALAVLGLPSDQLIATVAAHVEDGEVASRLRRAVGIRPVVDPRHAAAVLGCGLQISAPDTVPFAIWCAARHLDDLHEALWATASAGGDVDTTCAIVGGIVAGRTGLTGIPDAWTTAAEPLPGWLTHLT
ncbi:hydrolase [Longispora fulva]|nr:hydrolase [Longispora fulva]